MPPRLITLVAIHLALGLLPFCYGWVPPHVRYMPIIWLIGSITVAQALLLGFWLGMGTNPWLWRVLGSVLGCAWLGLPTITSGAPLQSLVHAGIVFLLGGMFLAMRRWYALDKLSTTPAEPPGSFQFSIFHLLVLTSAAAVMLGLVRSARLASTDSAWFLALAWGLMLSTFAINAASSAWAALALHACRPKIFAAGFVSFLLGLAICLIMSRPVTGALRLPWWIWLGGLYITTCLTSIIILTLLVVRSCGYRLLPRSLTAGP